MYGMINNGIRSFVQGEHGETAWRSILHSAGIEHDVFERMSDYPDAITYDIVGAISVKTGLTVDEVLRAFGEYFIEFANQSSFGHLMRVAGGDFVSRLKSLDDLHERIMLSMPHLKAPSFEVSDQGDRVYDLAYYSEREGLSALAVGLLHGMAAMSGERIEVRQTHWKADVDEPDRFEVRLV